MNKNTTCPVWGTTPASVTERAPSVSLVDSARAGGAYWIDTKAQDYLSGIDDQRVRARLTSWLVERRRLGEMRPHVTVQAVEDAERRPPSNVHERADRLLLRVASELADIADAFVSHQDESHVELQHRLARSESIRVNEVNYLILYLEQQHWIEQTNPGQHGTARYRLSVKGHARLAELAGTVRIWTQYPRHLLMPQGFDREGSFRHAPIPSHLVEGKEAGRVPQSADDAHQRGDRRWPAKDMNECFSAWRAR